MKDKQPLDSLLASIRAGLYAAQERQRAEAVAPKAPAPFVTVSRQAGAGGRTFARLLVDRLNALDPDAERPWAAWDRELVERVAREEHIPESLVETLEHPRGFMEQFLSGLSFKQDADQLDEFQVYRRLAHTIRGLAHAGRAVVVGRGGVYATSDLPGGVHVRLVAPIEQRVDRMADQMKVGRDAAAVEVRRLDRDREAFHRRYWQGKAMLPEVFTITLNASAMSEAKLVDCVLPLLVGPRLTLSMSPADGSNTGRQAPPPATSGGDDVMSAVYAGRKEGV